MIGAAMGALGGLTKIAGGIIGSKKRKARAKRCSEEYEHENGAV